MTTHKNTKYIFANWKMYVDFSESVMLAKQLAKKSKQFSANLSLAVFPSALSFTAVREEFAKTKVAVGAQNTHWVARGGLTGEISSEMFAGVGATYTLVGHSERRHMFHETDHEVRQKVEAALASHLTPVVCVGETAAERAAEKTEEIIEVQLRAAFDGIAWQKDKPIIVTYEPVWAISKGTEPGSGTPCDPDDAEMMHKRIDRFIRGLHSDVEPILLYGGSVRPHNAQFYVAQPHINGVLIGAASTKLDSLLEIIANVGA